MNRIITTILCVLASLVLLREAEVRDRNVEPRWIEWMKLFLAIIPFPEISAARSMAMVGRLGLRTIANTIHPYPTQAEAIKKLGDAYNRTRLTPTVKWLFEKWLSWTR